MSVMSLNVPHPRRHSRIVPEARVTHDGGNPRGSRLVPRLRFNRRSMQRILHANSQSGRVSAAWIRLRGHDDEGGARSRHGLLQGLARDGRGAGVTAVWRVHSCRFL